MKYLRNAKLVSLALLLVLTAGCASSPGASPSRQAAKVIRQANAVYEPTLIEAGVGNELGVIDDDQLAKIEAAGNVMYAALTSAKAALGAYVALGHSDANVTELNKATVALTAALTTFLTVKAQLDEK